MPTYHAHILLGLQILAKMLLTGEAHVAHMCVMCYISFIFQLAYYYYYAWIHCYLRAVASSFEVVWPEAMF